MPKAKGYKKKKRSKLDEVGDSLEKKNKDLRKKMDSKAQASDKKKKKK